MTCSNRWSGLILMGVVLASGLWNVVLQRFQATAEQSGQGYVVAEVRESLSVSQQQTQFERVEKALAELPIVDSQLVLSPQTVVVLDRAVSPYSASGSLTGEMSEARLSRIRLLVEKSVPAPVAAEVAELFVRYISLKQAEYALQSSLLTQQVNDPWQALQQQKLYYDSLTVLRQQYLGEVVSETLFAAQNSMTRYLLQRHESMVNAHLSPAAQ